MSATRVRKEHEASRRSSTRVEARRQVKAAKDLGLGGAILYATPGVIVVEARAEADVDEFAAACRRAGKPAEIVFRTGALAGAAPRFAARKLEVLDGAPALRGALAAIDAAEAYDAALGINR